MDEGHHVRYYIIGDGDHKERLKKEVNKLNLQENVIFLAATLNPYPFMRQTDIYLQPSFYEGHCITILEAKLLNKAMVCTNFTGAEEELREGITGIIVDIDSIAIFEGLKKLIENDNLRQSFEKNLIMEGLKTAVDPVASLFFSTLK